MGLCLFICGILVCGFAGESFWGRLILGLCLMLASPFLFVRGDVMHKHYPKRRTEQKRARARRRRLARRKEEGLRDSTQRWGL